MNIKFWKTASGRYPVKNFIMTQSSGPAQRIMKDIDHLKEQGLRLLASNKLKKLRGYDNLYELRTKHGKLDYRILFKESRGTAWLLEAFQKQGNTTPERYIKTAIRRGSTV
ncbi:MAG: hypothetical protein JWN82_254 [Candidatus Saccharibacteria bacterium]|nr:hypothetical protein [Candidatus Saccharibacteria bacterium]